MPERGREREGGERKEERGREREEGRERKGEERRNIKFNIKYKI
jgi:hypothetical protein